MDVATIATITIIIMIAIIRLVRLLLKFMIPSPTISIVIVILYLFYRFDYAILRYCGLVYHLLPLDGLNEAPTTVSLFIC